MNTPIPPHYFYLSQVFLGGAFILAAYFFLRPKDSKSNFKVREADREPGKNPRDPHSQLDDLAQARIEKKVPLQLSGIRIDGTPHEILGVSRDAPVAEIQRSHRELMKRFHPDLVGRPGSSEWSDAQKIAEAVNHAKDEMLKKKTPSR